MTFDEYWKLYFPFSKNQVLQNQLYECWNASIKETIKEVNLQLKFIDASLEPSAPYTRIRWIREKSIPDDKFDDENKVQPFDLFDFYKEHK